MALCGFATSPTNPLRRLRVSNRSRCGAVRICNFADEPFAEIVRVESLSLWRRADLQLRQRTLCGDCARIARAVAPRGIFLLVVLRRRGFDSPLVRTSSGSRIAILKHQSIVRNCAPAALAGKWKLLSTKVVHEVHSRSSQSARLQLRLESRNFYVQSSTRSSFPQLRLKACKFKVQKLYAKSIPRAPTAQSMF